MKNRLLRILGAGGLFALALFLQVDHFWLGLSLFLAAYLLVGFSILKRAIRNLFHGQVLDENFLMTLATLGAFAIQEYPEAVAVMLFYEIGELFQDVAVDRSRRFIAQAMQIVPDLANVYREGKLVSVDPDEVEVGEEILVKAGERVPLDGILLAGQGAVDSSALTGESLPRTLVEGDAVLSGCINLQASLRLRVTKDFSDSTVSTILSFVESSLAKKSKQEGFITRFARIYTPTVVGLALALAFLPPLFSGTSFSIWLYRALIFLVVSCPCALVVSIPLTFVGAMGGASRRGILVKGANYLESLAQVRTAVFDKTGTLTKGVFSVQVVHAEKGSAAEILDLAAHAEHRSTHPIAISIVEAYGKTIDPNRVAESQEIPGKGIQARVDGRDLLLGNAKMLEEAGISFQRAQEVGTILYLARDGEFLGSLVIADAIKEDAKQAMADLAQLGIDRRILFTGDSFSVAQEVAKNLSMSEVQAQLLPQDKVVQFEKILERAGEGTTLFVGDGINDAPVLARADVGMAMGALGSDAAIEAADIVLMTDEPSKIVTAVKIARKASAIARENTAFAIGVKVLVLVLASFGLSSMWAAIFADVGVTVLAILNAFRTLRIQD